MATTRSKPAAKKAVATKAAATKTTRAVASPANAAAGTTATASATGRAAAPVPASTPPAASGSERRRSPREKLVAPAVLQPSSGDASVDRGVQVQDLSLGGVGFVATEKFDPGEVYRITLGKGPLLLNARVRIISCNKTGHRMYRCGAEFC